MWDGITMGITTVLSPINLLAVFLGCFVGTFIGLLPGLGPISAIALMIPITYGLDPATGMILMSGVYYGAIFGGSTSSILINAPGVAGTVASSFDGYPLAKSGYAGKALALAAYSSFIGGTVATFLLLLTAPMLAKVSLSFQSSDYFMLMVLGLTAVAAFAGEGNYLKVAMMTIFGLMLSTIGTDLSTGVERYTFGSMDLLDGISFLLLAMASFALAEALYNILIPVDESKSSKTIITDLKLTKEEFKEVAPTIGRSSLLGFFVGILPGAGATIASFLSYGMERNLANKEQQQKFGKGSLKGLAAPETANNAACGGSFVPLLTLGIPGSGTTAIMLGALISYGVQPGPRLLVDHPHVFWSVIISMYIGNLVLLVINLPLIPYIAKLLTLPRPLLLPLILFFSLIGVYLISFNTMDLYIMVAIASISLVLRLLEFPMAPMLLGFILGRPMEDNLHRALIANQDSISFLWNRSITFIIFCLVCIIVILPIAKRMYSRLRK